MRFRALFLFVCCALVVVSTTLGASAQSVVIGATIARRADRPDGLDTRTINWDDCQAGDALEMAVSATNTAGLSLEVWAGTSNCDSDTARLIPAIVPSQCWQIARIEVAVSGVVSLAVRDIVPHNASGAGSGRPEVCNSANNGSVTLFFILTNGNILAGAGSRLPLVYDLRGPSAPTLNSAAPGDARLALSWSWSPTLEVDLKHYQLYCEPADSPDPELCTSSALSPGQPVRSAPPRGQTSSGAESGVAEGLTNDVRYACGVAGLDSVGNVGPLSNLVCAAPKMSEPPELTGRCQLGLAPVTPGTSVAVFTLLGCLAWRRARAQGRRGARDPS